MKGSELKNVIFDNQEYPVKMRYTDYGIEYYVEIPISSCDSLTISDDKVWKSNTPSASASKIAFYDGFRY